jgi:hypothetical protein
MESIDNAEYTGLNWGEKDIFISRHIRKDGFSES